MNLKIGLIAEYNPFHNGHIYQISRIKEQYPTATIIVVLGGNYTQRGDIALINKWDKTKIIMNHQVDLVVELPFVYNCQSADIFAQGAIRILKELQVDMLIFGSESNDLNTLTKIAQTNINNIIKLELKKGISYPKAYSNATKSINNLTTNNPNDILGIAYLKEINNQHLDISVKTIKRTTNYHAQYTNSNIASASYIRKQYLLENDITNFVPNDTLTNLFNASINKHYNYLKYQIINNIKQLNIFQTVDEGIENRIIKYIFSSNSYEELVNSIKTKRYTENKIRRMLLHIMVNFTKEEATNLTLDYIKILGFNLNGQKHLHDIKGKTNLPIIFSYKKNLSPILDIEHRVTLLYAHLINNPNLIKNEYINKPLKFQIK